MCTSPNFMAWTGKHQKTSDSIKLDFFPGTETNKKRLIDSGLLFVEVPCGKCLECRLAYTAQWSARCTLEASKYKDNYFVTLTYSDLQVPNDGELHPEHLQQFMKNIRKKFPDYKIKFFASGEYGSKNMRPHFHIILFNCPLNDLSYEFKMINNKGQLEVHPRVPGAHQDLMFSQTIFDCWNKKGMISVGKFSYDTAGYVAQYTMKKINNLHAKKIQELGLRPEFLRMSNRPGIGADTFDDTDIFRGDILIPAGLKTHYASVPRYFEKLFIKKYGEDFFNDSVRLPRNLTKIKNNEAYKILGKNQSLDAFYRNNSLVKKFIENKKL